MTNPSAELIAIHTSDNLELPGLFYSAPAPTHKAALYLHGNGDSGVLYKGEHINAFARHLNAHGISFLALNNRGARYKKSIRLIDEESLANHRKFPGGAHYEMIVDCVQDIDAAAAFLHTRGYTELYIIGESTGANKICVYNAQARANHFSKYVLAGPGDDCGLYYNELGKEKFRRAIDYAQQAIDSGNPLKVLPRYSGVHPLSAQSAYDILDPDQPYNTFPYYEATTKRLGTKELFGDYHRITKPMLVIFGENDEYTYTGGGTKAVLELLRSHTNKSALPKSKFEIIPNADHGFQGNDDTYASTVANWLAVAMSMR